MEKRTNDKGYVEVLLPEHPLAQKSGWCLEHRIVLYEQTGSREQYCYWCGWLLPWGSNYRTCINVDHLNEIRSDNRLTNLVPSCWWCNANRSWSRIAPAMWARARREFGAISPNDRPNMIHWLAARAEESLRFSPAPKDPVVGRAVLGKVAHGRNDDWLGKISHDHVLNPKLPERNSERYEAVCERWAEHLGRAVADKVITEQEARAALSKHIRHPEEIDLSELTDGPPA